MLTQEWDMGKALDIRFIEGMEKGVDREKIETLKPLSTTDAVAQYPRI